MKINFVNQTENKVKKEIRVIKKVFRKIKDKSIFNIIFVTDEEIQRINKEYRQIDRVTDVISFALNDNDELSFLNTNELGDIFISLNKAQQQALDYEHSLEREVGFLAVHGYLHLCGYDHLEKEDEEIMTQKQKEILDNAKLYR